MKTALKDLLMEDKDGPICRSIGVPVTVETEKKVDWLKKVKRVDVNKFLRKQLQYLIDQAEKGEFDRDEP